MKRNSILITTLKGFGYIILGNVMSLFVTMGLCMFGANIFLKALAALCSAVIFLSLVFTVAWKDGTRERSLVALHRVEGEQKHRWTLIGIFMFLFAAAPSIVLLLNKLFFPEADTLYVYRFISGSAYPFVLLFVEPVVVDEAWTGTTLRQIDAMSALFPALMTLYYALVPVAAKLGYWCGFNDKLNKDKIMYK